MIYPTNYSRQGAGGTERRRGEDRGTGGLGDGGTGEEGDEEIKSSCPFVPQSPSPPVSVSPSNYLSFVFSSNVFLFSGGNLSIAYRSVVRGILGPCLSRKISSLEGSGFPASRNIQPVAL